MFDKIVKPILLNGYEVWGFGNIVLAENYILNFEIISYTLRHQHQRIWFMGNLNDIHQ